MEDIRVVIVAADPLARRGLASLLGREPGLTVSAQLAAAVRAMRTGLFVLDDGLAAQALRPRQTATPALVEPLTPREMEVLQLLAQGLANKAIAERLRISDHTAKFHVNAILGKLDAESRTEAIVQAVRLGLVIL